MILKKSSKFPKNNPQMVHKKSSKVPERFFNVLRASVPQVFKKSSKGPQSPQKVKKMHKRYPRSSDLRFSNDPQNVLYFLKRPQIPRSPHRSTKGIQGDFKVLKNLSTSSKSSVGNQVRKILNVLKSHWNPQRHQVLNRFTRSHQTFLKDSSTFWEHQLLRSSKIPQRVQKVLKKSRKCTKGTQGPQTSGSQLILKMSSNSSKGHQSPRSPQRSTKGIPVDIKVPKKLSTSSKSCGRQKFLKCSLNDPQKVLKIS